MRAAVALIWAEIHAVLFLAQIVGGVDVAQQRQFLAVLLRPCGEFGDFLEQDVLMAHHHHRHVAAEHLADFGGAVAGGVDDDIRSGSRLAAVSTTHSSFSRRTPVTGQKRMIFAPMSRAPLASAWVSCAGSMSPSLGS